MTYFEKYLRQLELIERDLDKIQSRLIILQGIKHQLFKLNTVGALLVTCAVFAVVLMTLHLAHDMMPVSTSATYTCYCPPAPSPMPMTLTSP